MTITKLPIPYRKHMDTELQIAFWHLSTSQKALDELVQSHKRCLPFTGGYGYPGPATGLIERWEADMITLDQQMQECIAEMTRRKMAMPDYATERQSASDEWQAVFDSYEEHLGGLK